MFKLISIVVLFYIMYKLVFPSNALNESKQEHLTNQKDDETIDIDYEELD